MNTQEKFGLGCLVLCVFFMIFCFASYITNIVKLTKLDFKEPYKAEVIRGIGLIPPVGVVIGFIKIND